MAEESDPPVCVMTPPSGLARTIAACIEVLAQRTPVKLDEDFGADLLDIIGPR